MEIIHEILFLNKPQKSDKVQWFAKLAKWLKIQSKLYTFLFLQGLQPLMVPMKNVQFKKVPPNRNVQLVKLIDISDSTIYIIIFWKELIFFKEWDERLFVMIFLLKLTANFIFVLNFIHKK